MLRRRWLCGLLLGGCRLTGSVAAPESVASLVTVQRWPADAEVRVDGAQGVAAERAPGAAMVRVERPGFAPTELEVVLREGEHRRLDVRLEGLPTTLQVDSVPAGAEVSIDGAMVGTTPWTGEHPAGDVTVDVVLEGWQRETVERFVDGPALVELWLDPPDQRLDRVRLIHTCRRPKAVLLHPERDEAWVACLAGPPSVVAHDLHTGEELASIDLGDHGAVELHWSADGERLYASQMETHTVHEIDVGSREVLRTMNAVSLWSKVIERSAEGTHLFVSNWLGDDVTELRLSDGVRSRRFPTVTTPRGLYATADGRSLYVAGFDAGSLARIDLISGRSTTLWTGGFAGRHLVADEARGRLYLSDMGLDALFVHDMTEGTTDRLTDLIRNPNTIDLSDDREVVFASCRGQSGSGGYLTVGQRGGVFAVDAMSGRLLDAIAGGRQPTGLDVRGDWLVFSDFRDDRLQVYRIPPTEELRKGGRSLESVKAELRLPDPVPGHPASRE